MTGYVFTVFDTSCHLFASDDVGSSWGGSCVTPNANWLATQMAINDEDYQTVIGFAYEQYVSKSTVALALANQTVLGWGWTDLSFPISGGGLDSGAVSTLAGIIIAPKYFGSYPKISFDSGKNWSDLTSAPIGSYGYRKACMSHNADYIYMVSADGTVPVVSTDLTSSWTSLSAFPTASIYAAINWDRMRCSQDGSKIFLSTHDYSKPILFYSLDGGVSWNTVDFSTVVAGLPGTTYNMDMDISLDGTCVLVTFSQSDGSNYMLLSKDSASTWNRLYPNLIATAGYKALVSAISPDGQAISVFYNYPSYATLGKGDLSIDQGASWTTTTWDVTALVEGTPGIWSSAHVLPVSSFGSSPTSAASGGTVNASLIGATYRRTNAFPTEKPKALGWHRHDLGHSRTLTSMAVSSEPGGLLDHLDMVTTDGANYYVEGFTQIFDEDDALSDGWFLDGALVPDSAYEDTVGGVTGIRFTGLWWLRTTFVTVCAFGLDLGDFTVDTSGTVFVPYGSGTAPSSYDYTAAGAGAYLFTAAYIAANVASTAPRNGGVYINGGYMPVVVGYSYTSQGQILRPLAPEESGSRTGPAFGMKGRTNYVTALLQTTLGIQFGTDFGTTLQQADLKDDAGTWPTPDAPFSGIWHDTINDDYTYDGMVSWQIVRPYPASVISIGATRETNDP